MPQTLILRIGSNYLPISVADPMSSTPGMPLDVVARVINDDEIAMVWTAADSTQTQFHVQANVNDAGYNDSDYPLAANPVTSYVGDFYHSPTVPGSTIALKVAAANNSGLGPYTTPVTLTLPAAPSAPAAPTLVSVTAPTPHGFTLTWTVPSLAGIKSLRVERTLGDGVTGASWSEVKILPRYATYFHDTNQSVSFDTANKLQPSTRYAYRVRTYTPGQVFSAYSGVVSAVTPARPSYTITSSHPRLLSSARKTVLLDRVSRNTARWQVVKNNADTLLAQAAAPGSGSGGDIVRSDYPYTGAICNLALAYQATGNAAYAAKAIEWMGHVAVSTNVDDLGAQGLYLFRYELWDMAYGFDLCYDQLTSGQKVTFSAWMQHQADYWTDETNGGQHQYGANNPDNNYFYGAIQTWAAAIACVGEAAVNAAALAHVDLMLTYFYTKVRSYTDNQGLGGVFGESSNYESNWMLFRVLDAFNLASGVDLINDANWGWPAASLLTRFHGTAPDLIGQFGWGYQSRQTPPALYYLDRLKALQLLASLDDTGGNPLLKEQTRDWLNAIAASGAAAITYVDGETNTQELLYFDETAATADYTATLPTFFAPAGPGIVIKRADWSASAAVLNYFCGDGTAPHADPAQCGFQVYKGGPLIGTANLWSQGGPTPIDMVFNVPASGTFEQVPTYVPTSTHWPETGGDLQVREDDPSAGYTYLRGDGTANYVVDQAHNGGRPVAEFVRKLLMLSGDSFVVLDRFDAIDPGRVKRWAVHSQNAPTVAGSTYKFDNGSYKVLGGSLAPAGVTLAAHGDVTSNPPGAATSYRIESTYPTGNTLDYILHAFSIAAVGSADPTAPRLATVTAGNVLAAVVGAWVAVLGKADLATTPIAYHDPTPPRNHVIADLTPGGSYTMTIRDAGGVTLGSPLSLTASGSGTVTFTGPGTTEFSFTLS